MRKRNYHKANGNGIRILLGIGVGFLVMIAGAAGFAWLIEKEMLAREHMGIMATGLLAAGGFLGGLCAGRGEGRLARAAAVGAGLVMVLLLLNLVLFGGSWSGVIPGLIAVLGSASAASLIGAGDRKKWGRRRYGKYANR